MSKYPHYFLKGENFFVTPTTESIKNYCGNFEGIRFDAPPATIVDVPYTHKEDSREQRHRE